MAVPYRPLGKSGLVPTPWYKSDVNTEYIPTVMKAQNIKLGLIKARDPEINFPEVFVRKAESYIAQKMKSIWVLSAAAFVKTYDEAVADLSLDKSPGFPYYYKYSTKGETLEKEGEVVKERVMGILNGVPVACNFALTQKSELRPREKVLVGKTRIFMASDLHHLIASDMLFDRQNEILMDTLGQHPITVGISMPGPEYVSTILKLGTKVNDGDVDGCDLRFKLRIARSIRNLRKSFLPPNYATAVDHIYNTVYCGTGVVLGNMYRLYGNKSGWKNTSQDNSFMTWYCLVIACFALYPTRTFDEVMNPLINGDDILVQMINGDFKEVCTWLSQYGMYITADDFTPRRPEYCVYLSHHVEKRFVSTIGDFYVAAGNLPKLLSSLNWVRKNENLTFPECCVAHLVGIRMCLFPWALEFEAVDEILSEYLRTVIMTKFMRECLKARFNDREMALLHTRYEGFGSNFSLLECKNLYQVEPQFESLINKHVKKQICKSQTFKSNTCRAGSSASIAAPKSNNCRCCPSSQTTTSTN